MTDRTTSASRSRRKSDLWLMLALLSYGIVNFTCILMAASGVIHPPWNLLAFFIFFAPSGFLLTVAAIHTRSRLPVFSWWSLFVAVAAMCLAVFLNLLALASAIAAV